MLAQVVVAVLLLVSSHGDYELPKIAQSAALRAVLLVVLVIGVLFGTFWVGGDRLATNFENATNEIASRHRVDLDTTIKTLADTGKDMSTKYKETSEAGLAANLVLC